MIKYCTTPCQRQHLCKGLVYLVLMTGIMGGHSIKWAWEIDRLKCVLGLALIDRQANIRGFCTAGGMFGVFVSEFQMANVILT